MDRTEDIEISPDRPVDILGLRPGDHDAATDPHSDVQLGVAEAHPGANQGILPAPVENNVGPEAPPRPTCDRRQRQPVRRGTVS